MLSFTAASISSAVCSTILCTFVFIESRIFCNLEISLSQMTFCGVEWYSLTRILVFPILIISKF
jgi:hypothetical protein